jgi:hypothetical protein
MTGPIRQDHAMPDQKFQYVHALADRVAADHDLAEKIKQDPPAVLRQLAATGPIPDTWIYRIVVIFLGAVVVLTVLCAAILAGMGHENIQLPEGAIAIGAAAGGALAGLLAPSPAGN